VRLSLAIPFAFTLAFSSAADAGSAEVARVFDLYQRGVRGDHTAVENCISILEEVIHRDAANQLARVYLGSAYTLRSRDLGFGPKKLEALRHGVALMDEAVAAAPDDPKVRLARALTTNALPFFAAPRESSREDFEKLAALAQRSPEGFEPADLQIVFYNAALAAKKSNDTSRATALLELAAAHPVDRDIAAKVNAALNR
jgi:hypothetical protein